MPSNNLFAVKLPVRMLLDGCPCGCLAQMNYDYSTSDMMTVPLKSNSADPTTSATATEPFMPHHIGADRLLTAIHQVNNRR